MQGKKRCLVGILLFFFFHCLWAASSDLTSKPQKFISIADIHFNPFSGCENKPRPCDILQKLRTTDFKKWNSIWLHFPMKAASYGEDTNYVLLQESLQKLKQIYHYEKPDFALVLGDFLSHNFIEKYRIYSGDKSLIGCRAFIKKTLEYVTEELISTFPDISIFPAIGNNDSYTGDYQVVPNGMFLHDAAMIWSKGIRNSQNQQDFLREFPKGGYYQIQLPYHQKILILNTVLFSPSCRDKNLISSASEEELHWLKLQLTEAQKNSSKVILAFHIPMDVEDSYPSLSYLLFYRGFWQLHYDKEWRQIVRTYPGTITALLPAHLHMDISQFFAYPYIPIIFTSSVSPIFGNSPSMKVFSYNVKNLTLEDHQSLSLL